MFPQIDKYLIHKVHEPFSHWIEKTPLGWNCFKFAYYSLDAAVLSLNVFLTYSLYYAEMYLEGLFCVVSITLLSLFHVFVVRGIVKNALQEMEVSTYKNMEDSFMRNEWELKGFKNRNNIVNVGILMIFVLISLWIVSATSEDMLGGYFAFALFYLFCFSHVYFKSCTPLPPGSETNKNKRGKYLHKAYIKM